MHMASVEIPESCLEVLAEFGDVQELTRNAIKRYIIELATQKMEEFKTAIDAMESKYGCDYRTFISLSVQPDFRSKVLDIHKDWKKDLLTWERNTQNLSMWVVKVACIHE